MKKFLWDSVILVNFWEPQKFSSSQTFFFRKSNRSIYFAYIKIRH